MIFKTSLEILEKIFTTFPYFRYNDTEFFYIEESYLSKDGKQEKPWKEPVSVTICRAVARQVFPDNVEFEKNLELLKKHCKDFFDENLTKTLSGLKRFLITGTQEELEATEIANWKALQAFIDKTSFKDYLNFGRYIIRIPCGEWNINLVKVSGLSDIFLEITSIHQNEEIPKKLLTDLGFEKSDFQHWTDVAINHSIAEES